MQSAEAPQFLRIEAFSFREMSRIVGEASRAPEYCRHVPTPEEPLWLTGSAEAVIQKAEAFMAVPCAYTHKNGKKRFRKRRDDARCIMGGVCSWPMEVDRLVALSRNDKEAYRREMARVKEWLLNTRAWLRQVFGTHFAGMVVHKDESHVHAHFFCVGEANVLHPGLRSEYQGGRRLESGRERGARYRLVFCPINS